MTTDDRATAATLRALARQLRDQADATTVHPWAYALGLRDAALTLDQEADAHDYPGTTVPKPDHIETTNRITPTEHHHLGLVHGPRLGTYIDLTDGEQYDYGPRHLDY